MKNVLLFATISTLLLMCTFTSCKKEGCMDDLATNYFSKVKKDDGSCSYSTTRMEGRYSYVWNDTLKDTATVYSYEKSQMKVEGGEFDFMKTQFMMLVTWSAKTMHMPDSLISRTPNPFDPSSPYTGRINGEILTKDNFTITYVQQIATWNNLSVKKDTTFIYDFTRI